MLTFCSRLCRALALRGRRICPSPTPVEELLLSGSEVRSEERGSGCRSLSYTQHTVSYVYRFRFEAALAS